MDLLRVQAIEHVKGNIADLDVEALIVAHMHAVVLVWQGFVVAAIELPNLAPVSVFAPTTTPSGGCY
jgi:hypothetical protein